MRVSKHQFHSLDSFFTYSLSSLSSRISSYSKQLLHILSSVSPFIILYLVPHTLHVKSTTLFILKRAFKKFLKTRDYTVPKYILLLLFLIILSHVFSHINRFFRQIFLFCWHLIAPLFHLLLFQSLTLSPLLNVFLLLQGL